MDTTFQALIMGIVQGLTEFLPVSSSGHLVIVPHLLGWTDPFITSLAFSVMLHLGTLVALLVYFWRDWLAIVPAGLATIRDRSFRGDPNRQLAWLLVVATIPAADRRADPQRHARGGGPDGRGRGDRAGRRRRDPVAGGPGRAQGRRASSGSRSRSPSRIGIAQAIALVPGISRVRDEHLGRPVRRADPRGGGPVQLPDGDPGHRRGGALRGPQPVTGDAGVAVAGRRRSWWAWSRRSWPAWPRSTSCCATSGRRSYLRLRGRAVVSGGRRPRRVPRALIGAGDDGGDEAAPPALDPRPRRPAPDPDPAGAGGGPARARLPDDPGDDQPRRGRAGPDQGRTGRGPRPTPCRRA